MGSTSSMPKYQYPSYVYDRNTATKGDSLIGSGDALISTTEEERKAFLGEGGDLSDSDEEESEEDD